MKVVYQRNNYDVGNPSTLLDLKQKLQAIIKDIQKRELMIMVREGKNQVLLEEKDYTEFVQKFKSNNDIKLQCFILKHYLKNLLFQNSQLQNQIDYIKQKENLKNTSSQDSCQTIQNQEQTDSYKQSISQVIFNKNTNLLNNQRSTQETIKLYDESASQETIKSYNEQFSQETIKSYNELVNLEQNEKQKNQRSQIIIESQIDDNKNQQIERYNNQKSQMVIQSYIDDNENQRDERYNNESQFKTLNPNCMNCNQKIQLMQFFLNCGHTYHENCLKENLKNQIQQFNSKLYCQCNSQIKHPQKILTILDLQIQFYKLLNNQLNHIKKINKGIRKCPNNGCSFFVIIEHNEICKSFCPSCLMQVILE